MNKNKKENSGINYQPYLLIWFNFIPNNNLSN